jgi:hypothetical protein
MKRVVAVVVGVAVLGWLVAAPAAASSGAKAKPLCADAESLVIIGPIANTFTSADLQTMASIGRQFRKVKLKHVNAKRLGSRVTASLGSGYAAQLAAITAVANACIKAHVIVATPAPTTSTTSPLASTLPSGTYTNGPSGTPHYFITLTTSTDGTLSGTVTFLAQDGRTPTAFTFTGTSQDGVATLTPSQGSTITAPFSANQLTLDGCTTYLQFATSTSDCLFSFSPGGVQ